jgi:hypothetical protein
LPYQSNKKILDIFVKWSILGLIPKQFSIPVNFQQNLNLPEMAMKERHPKVLKVKPPRDLCSLLGAFSFCEVIPWLKNEPGGSSALSLALMSRAIAV